MPNSRTRTPRGVRATLRAVAAASLLAGLAASETGAQERGCTARRPRVESLRITGNRSISGDTLRSILFTERASRLRRWFGWDVGPFACLDSTELRNDARRIVRWYELRGYPGTTATVTTAPAGDRATKVHFTVREARPVRMDSITIEGLPPRVVDRTALLAQLRGQPLDDSLLALVGDSLRDVLRNAGYVRARRPTHAAVVDSARRRARVALRFEPGNLIRIGRIDVAMTANDPAHPALPEDDIRTMLRIAPGDVYDPQAIAGAQQRLYTSGIYRTVAIDSLANGGALGDTIPVQVRLTEGKHHSLRSGGGWGTLDCFRTQTRYVSQNFLGRAHRLQLEGRLAKIGTGAPLDGFDALCAPGVRADTFSRKLNYYAGATVQWRGIVGERWHPQVTVYSERRTEFQSYLRETTIGTLASVERPLIPRVGTVFTYRYDQGRTFSDQAVACAVFGLCRFNDRVFLVSPSRLHAAGVTFSRSAPAISQFVMNDERWAIETRLGTIRIEDADRRVNFNRTQLEYALYRPLTRWLVGAARVQAGAVVTRRDLESFVPPQERFFSGGQNTVRGFGQNQLGPAVYVVGAFDTVSTGGYDVGEADGANGFDRLTPAGGTATALLNLELRTRNGWPIDLLRWAAFVDAGRVWNNTGNYSVTGLRVTPGLGVRLVTPLGPFRVDIGYNRYGYERGPAFFLVNADPATGTPGRAICVSPGTTEPIDPAAADLLGPVPCPATFVPSRPRSLLSRLAFHFSIGEAF